MAVKKNQGETSWLEECWRTAKAMEKATNRVIRFGMAPASRRGVFELRVQLCSHVDGKATAVDRQMGLEYPNAEAVSLAGSMFKLITALDAEVAADVFGDDYTLLVD